MTQNVCAQGAEQLPKKRQNKDYIYSLQTPLYFSLEPPNTPQKPLL